MVSSSIDYYQELGIDRYAKSADIRNAYKRLALRWHPDRNKAKEAEEKFKTIKQAYDVLIDENRRRQYDEEHFPIVKESPSSSSTWFDSKTYEHSFNIQSFEDLMSVPIDPLDILSDLQFFQESNFTSKMLNSPEYRQLYTQLFHSMNNGQYPSSIPTNHQDRFTRSSRKAHGAKGRRSSKRASVPVFPSYMMNDPWSFVDFTDPFFQDFNHCQYCREKISGDRRILLQHEDKCRLIHHRY